MATIEKIMQMRQQGKNEEEIATSLREQGASPREINESLAQSQIKSALNSNPEAPQTPTQELNPLQSEMQSSIMPTGNIPQSPQQTSVPSPYPESAPQLPYSESPSPASQEPAPYPPQGQPSPEQYPQDQYYPEQPEEYYPEYQAADVETMNDIAEQIVEEKIQDLKKKTASLVKFKEDAKLEIEKLNKKVEKMEDEFNTLQTAVLKKVGDYGDDIKNIANEMHATQDSFSKILNPAIDNIRESEENGKPIPKTSKSRKVKKSKNSFEHYLR